MRGGIGAAQRSLVGGAQKCVNLGVHKVGLDTGVVTILGARFPRLRTNFRRR
jgi:hypothetical protein